MELPAHFVAALALEDPAFAEAGGAGLGGCACAGAAGAGGGCWAGCAGCWHGISLLVRCWLVS